MSDIDACLRDGFYTHAVYNRRLTRQHSAAVDHHQTLLTGTHQTVHTARLIQTRADTQGLDACGEQGGCDALAWVCAIAPAIKKQLDRSRAVGIVNAHCVLLGFVADSVARLA
ncbi:hypothetical protein ABH945_006055 [Paraburkholderia sp. GAS333]